MAEEGWWAIVVRLTSRVEGDDQATSDEYSLRIVQANELAEAKKKAFEFVRSNCMRSLTTDGKEVITEPISIIGAEFIGADPLSDGAEIWSRLAFYDRDEDRPSGGGRPPLWALRAFFTDWNVDQYEERFS